MTSNQLNELQTVFNDPENFYYIVDHFGNLMMKINTNVEPKYIKKDISKLLKSNKGIKFKINMWQFSLNFVDLLKWLGPLLIILSVAYFSEKKKLRS